MFIARCAGILPRALADMGIGVGVWELPGEEGRELGLDGGRVGWACCSASSSWRTSRRCLMELCGGVCENVCVWRRRGEGVTG